jgi:hypothetical protein
MGTSEPSLLSSALDLTPVVRQYAWRAYSRGRSKGDSHWFGLEDRYRLADLPRSAER